MIIYALIVRSKDGLALSASTDFNDEGTRGVKESKKYLKLLAKKTYQFPDRCVLNTGSHTIYLLTALGVSYLALCDSSYPVVLAFSFLNELMKEFLSKYQVLAVNQARRPYTFIEFNNSIHTARQRYNKPQSLSTRINLGELSEEIRLRPPHIVSLAEVQPLNGFHPINLSKAAVGPPPKLEPINWFGYVSIVVACLLSIIDVLRALASSSYGFDDLDGSRMAFHSFIFFSEAIVRMIQNFLFIHGGRLLLGHLIESSLCVIVQALLGFLVWDLRDVWQNGLRIFVTVSLQWLTFRRKLQLTLPSYNV